MIYKRAIFISFVLGAFMPGVSHAAKLDVSNLSGAWSIGNFKTCKADGSADNWWCLKGGAKCGSAFSTLSEQYDGVAGGDEYVRLAWVARTIKEGGAYFCPTEIRAANTDASKSAWTEYYDLGGKCYWMCKDGWTGSTCETKISASTSITCLPDAIDAQKNIARASAKATNIEDKIPMFRLNDYRMCDNNTSQEHDMILMAVTEDDHTMIAQAMTIRAGVKKTDQIYSAPFFSIEGAVAIPLCRPGYKPKANSNVWSIRCEPIDQQKCDMNSMAWCDGFPKSGYSASKHTLNTDGNCIKYFCSNSKEGFPADGDAKTCSKCNPEFPLGGVNTETGRCVTCESGEWFDEKKGECVDAQILTKTDMQYGPGKTKNASTNVEEQCWTMVSPDDYNCCMTGNGCPAKEDGTISTVPLILKNKPAAAKFISTKLTQTTTTVPTADVCPADSTGAHPDCVCNDSTKKYRSWKQSCETVICPSRGTYPNCECATNEDYDAENNICKVVRCDGRSNTGEYPNCQCVYENTTNVRQDSTYYPMVGVCRDNSCPTGTTGTYPYCICNYHDKSMSKDRCEKTVAWAKQYCWLNTTRWGNRFNDVATQKIWGPAYNAAQDFCTKFLYQTSLKHFSAQEIEDNISAITVFMNEFINMYMAMGTHSGEGPNAFFKLRPDLYGKKRVE